MKKNLPFYGVIMRVIGRAWRWLYPGWRCSCRGRCRRLGRRKWCQASWTWPGCAPCASRRLSGRPCLRPPGKPQSPPPSPWAPAHQHNASPAPDTGETQDNNTVCASILFLCSMHYEVLTADHVDLLSLILHHFDWYTSRPQDHRRSAIDFLAAVNYAPSRWRKWAMAFVSWVAEDILE